MTEAEKSAIIEAIGHLTYCSGDRALGIFAAIEPLIEKIVARAVSEYADARDLDDKEERQ